MEFIEGPGWKACFDEERDFYAGLDKMAEIISNGEAVAGTIYNMINEEAKNALDEADVILAKGQGNYETMLKFKYG